jgi:hypothetical protein
MKTHIKILTIIGLVFTLAAFAFAAWCALNAFKIGDVSSTVKFTMYASVNLLCFIDLVTH